MFKRIEKWLVGIVATEVAKLDTSLHVEKEKLVGVVSTLETSAAGAVKKLEARSEELFQTFEQRLIAEASRVVGERNQLIGELHTKIVELEQTARKITHWKVDSSTSEADHSLKVVK
jgi:recombinational DNA repair ATPase RecF